MGTRQVLISLGLILLSCLTAAAEAQTVGLDTCSGLASGICGPPEWTGTLTSCNGRDLHFSRYVGRIGWILRSVAPIVIELDTHSIGPVQFPLYVEIVPNPVDGCATPGRVVMHGYGDSGPCGITEQSPVIDVTQLAPVGTLYALRIYFVALPGRPHQTPALRCVRVIPQTQAPIGSRSWGLVKALFR